MTTLQAAISNRFPAGSVVFGADEINRVFSQNSCGIEQHDARYCVLIYGDCPIIFWSDSPREIWRQADECLRMSQGPNACEEWYRLIPRT